MNDLLGISILLVSAIFDRVNLLLTPIRQMQT